MKAICAFALLVTGNYKPDKLYTHFANKIQAKYLFDVLLINS